jgi:hypothetical protein
VSVPGPFTLLTTNIPAVLPLNTFTASEQVAMQLF